MSNRRRTKESAIEKENEADDDVASIDAPEIDTTNNEKVKPTGRIVYSTNKINEADPEQTKSNSKPKKDNDPTSVPKGSFFLHDDRDGGSSKKNPKNNNSRKSKRSQAVNDLEWKHDKYEELFGVKEEPRVSPRKPPPSQQQHQPPRHQLQQHQSPRNQPPPQPRPISQYQPAPTRERPERYDRKPVQSSKPVPSQLPPPKPQPSSTPTLEEVVLRETRNAREAANPPPQSPPDGIQHHHHNHLNHAQAQAQAQRHLNPSAREFLPTKSPDNPRIIYSTKPPPQLHPPPVPPPSAGLDYGYYPNYQLPLNYLEYPPAAAVHRSMGMSTDSYSMYHDTGAAPYPPPPPPLYDGNLFYVDSHGDTSQAWYGPEVTADPTLYYPSTVNVPVVPDEQYPESK